MTIFATRSGVRSLMRPASKILANAVAIVAIFLLASPVAVADQTEVGLVLPSGTEFVVVEDARKAGLAARFRGEIWLHGRFVAHWPGGASDRSQSQPEYILIPDAADTAKLPHYELREGDAVLRYAPERIEIDADPHALRLAVGEAQAKRLLDRRIDRVDSRGRFLIGRYSVGVECDAPWARATLLRVDRDDGLARGLANIPELC